MIKVDPDVLYSAAEKIDDLLSQYESLEKSLGRRVVELGNSWHGYDYQQYQNRFSEKERQLKGAVDDLRKYSDMLRKSAGCYTSVQQSIILMAWKI